MCKAKASEAAKMAAQQVEGEEKKSLGAVMGEVWKTLPDEEKRPYQEAYDAEAKVYKEKYAEEYEAWKLLPRVLLSDMPPKPAKAAASVRKSTVKPNGKFHCMKNPDVSALPHAIITKIMTLDPQVARTTKEATKMVCKATEIFVEWFAGKTWSVAQVAKKKSIKQDSMVSEWGSYLHSLRLCCFCSLTIACSCVYLF